MTRQAVTESAQLTTRLLLPQLRSGRGIFVISHNTATYVRSRVTLPT